MISFVRVMACVLALLAGCIGDPQVDKVPDSGDDDAGDPDAGDTDTGTGGPGDLTVTFIDVGQGDSALLELPDGEIVLVDGGDNSEGFAAILPLLDEKGIEVVDLMVLTHPHSDHCGGLDEVLLAKEVSEIWENGETLETATYLDYADARDAEGAAVLLPEQDYERVYGDASIAVLNTDEGYEGENSDSIVLRVELGQTAVLLTGDIEADEQADLVDDYGSALGCDVIKVPHHGSWNLDPNFVELASPDYAVISCGEVNDYGHPHQEAIDAYLDVGAVLCITFEAGDITARSDGADVEFDCASPRQ